MYVRILFHPLTFYPMGYNFDYGDVKHHPRRSGFDLSKKVAFTAKVGELLPVYSRLTYPGDVWHLKQQHFTRTRPVNTSAYTRVREYFDWFWLPLRLINKNLPQAIVGMQNQPVQALDIKTNRTITTEIPHTAYAYKAIADSEDPSGYPVHGLVNQFGFSCAATSAKLLSYLNYGNIIHGAGNAKSGVSSDPDFQEKDVIALDRNILTLAAYQKFYCDYFRFDQWEKSEPFTFNFDYYQGGDIFAEFDQDQEWKDYLSNNNLFTLRYCNWKKDLFMGVLPSSQLGDVSSVSLSSDTSSLELNIPDVLLNANTNPVSKTPIVVGSSQGNGNVIKGQSGTLGEGYNITTAAYNGPGVSGSLTASFNILQLRLAEAVQRYREIQQCGDQDYLGQLEQVFGVKLPAVLGDHSTWIGGSASNLDISEVVNTAIINEYEPTIHGKGVGTGNGFEKFECKEHGVLMCIYHAVPLLDYNLTSPCKELLYTDCSDLPNPVLDNIGMESLPAVLLSNSPDAPFNSSQLISTILGYAPRYFELKTDVDQVYGAFRTTLKDWVAPISSEYLAQNIGFEGTDLKQSLNFNFFKVNPSIMDSIFAVKADSTWDTDQLLVNAMFEVHAVRNFDYDGMPY